MKSTIAVSATVLALLIATAASAKPPWMGHGMDSERHLDRRIEQMTERLDLTPEQQTEIRSIVEAQFAQRDARRQAVRAEIDAVLTDEQRAQRDARMDQRAERRAARIADRLDLSPEQATGLRALMAEKRDNPGWSHDEMHQQLSTILTDDQLAQLEEMGPRRGRGGRRNCRK